MTLSQVRIFRPPSPQKWPYLYKRCPLCWTEWKVNFPIFIFRVMVDCIYNLLVCHLNFYVRHRPKKNSYICGQIYRKDRCASVLLWDGFFLTSYFFCATYSFWDMVDFIYVQSWCKISNTWNHPYTKLTTSQKLKVGHKKTPELKNPFQSIAHLSSNFTHFWTRKNKFGWRHTNLIQKR